MPNPVRDRRIIFRGSGAFTPAFVPGLRLWLDARAITGKTDGQGIQTWNDGSSAGNNFTQNTAGNQPLYKTATPLNSNPVVRFAAAGTQYMDDVNSILTQNFSVFWLGRYRDNAANQTILSQNNSAAGRTVLGFGATCLRAFEGGGAGAITSAAGSITDGSVYVLGYVRNGTGAGSLVGRANGAQILSQNCSLTPPNCAIRLGANNITSPGEPGNSDFCIVLVYNRTLSAAEIKQVEQYLARIGGVALS